MKLFELLNDNTRGRICQHFMLLDSPVISAAFITNQYGKRLVFSKSRAIIWIMKYRTDRLKPKIRKRGNGFENQRADFKRNTVGTWVEVWQSLQRGNFLQYKQL